MGLTLLPLALGTLKDEIWNLEYIDLSLLLRHNFNFPNENHNYIAVDNGRLVLQSVNKPAKKHIENISMWTDAFKNYAKVLITKHPLLIRWSLPSIIRESRVLKTRSTLSNKTYHQFVTMNLSDSMTF
jgi:hypothetical protein